ncbi:MAG TPA: hypothetical protein VLJ39_14455, partial [Tepidisphaeraceae bacterium]|nr:hypothetical protein [Tepidisphaeraceae bacterium]
QFGIPSPTFWEAYRIIFWSANTALFVQIWFALRGAEGRSRLFLAISIAAMRLLVLAQLLVSLRMASNPSAFLRAHHVLWGWVVLGNSAVFGLTGVLLLGVAYALRRPETQNRLE